MLWWALQQLKSSSPDVRLKAARNLGSANNPKAVPALIRILQDEDPEVRLAAIEALGAIGHPASAEPLVSALTQQSKEAKTSVAAEHESLARALTQVGAPSVQPLIRALGSDDRETRRWAAFALGLIRDGRAVDPLVGKLEDSRSEVRKAAALSLGQIGDLRAQKPLIRALANRDLETRRAAAEALGCLRSAEGTNALMRAVEDSNEAVQIAAVHSLAKIGGLSVAACLRAAMSGARKTVRDAAAAALQGMSFSPQNPEERAELAVILGNFEAASREGQAAIPALVRALEFKDPQMRIEAARSLASLPSPDSVQPLLCALKDHHADVQRSAARALAVLGERARPGLEETLAFYDASVVRLAADVLGEIGAPASARALVELVAENSCVPPEYPDLFEAVCAASESLGKILASSAAQISQKDLDRIKELPDKLRLLGPSPRTADLTQLHDQASGEMARRNS